MIGQKALTSHADTNWGTPSYISMHWMPSFILTLTRAATLITRKQGLDMALINTVGSLIKPLWKPTANYTSAPTGLQQNGT